MKRVLLLLMLLAVFHGMAQKVYPWDDHIFPFCTDENPYGITYNSGTRGVAGFPKEKNVGCLGSTPGPMWYYMQIDQPGDLLIYIEQFAINDHRLLDVDFACWGPFQAESKRDFLHKLRHSYRLEVKGHPSHRPSGGNHSGDMGGYPFNNLVDCSFAPDGTEWCFIPHAKTGEWYLLLITNYSREPGQIHFERVDNKSTATTNCNMTLPVTITPAPKGLRKIDDRTSAICLYEDKALVTIELEADDGYSLSNQSLKQTKVTVYANGRTYNTRLVDGHFECEIDIENDTTSYYAIVECPDPEFRLQTEQYFLVRTNDCDPDKIPLVRGDTVRPGNLNIADLKRGDKPVDVDLPDKPDCPKIKLIDYDVKVESDSPFVEEVRVSKEDNKLRLTPKLRGGWCDCFIPDSLTFRVMLLPKKLDNGEKPIEIPVVIGVERQSSWIARCMWVVVVLAALLVFFCYLRSLSRKRRFKKQAMITPVYYNRYGEEIDDGSGQPLRKSGFSAWFARWFVPGTERNTLGFESPEVQALRFIAAESPQAVEVPKDCIDSETMEVDGYDPENDIAPSRPIKLGANGRIHINKSNGEKEGYLYFTPGSASDGKGYRLFVGLLMVADAGAILVLLIALVKSLL